MGSRGPGGEVIEVWDFAGNYELYDPIMVWSYGADCYPRKTGTIKLLCMLVKCGA
jgi:hypothetical protein